MKFQMPKSKFQIMNILEVAPFARMGGFEIRWFNSWTVLCLLIFLNLLSTARCVKFHSQKTIVEPVNVVIIDESRVDNLKIRHIFKEFFLKEIIKNNSKGRLNIFDADTLNNRKFDYLISYDIMDYRSVDIEKGTQKLLVSTKIIRFRDKEIINSFVNSAVGKDIEEVSQKVAENLGRTLVSRLIVLYRYKMREVSVEPGDSL